MCQCACQRITFWTLTCTGLHETRLKGQVNALLGCILLSLTWVGSVNTLENGIFTHTRTHTYSTDTLLLILALVLPEIAEITGITVFTALIHCRLKPLNNSASTHKHTRTHSAHGSCCGLSGAADGWLIDWGGPLVISVANDLLNNSLGLCWGTDGRPNTYTDMFTGRLAHTCALMHLFVLSLCIYSNIFGHIHTIRTLSPASTHQGASVSLPCCWHLGCFTSAPPLFPWYHSAAHSLSEQEKKSYQKLLSPSLVAIDTNFIPTNHYFSFFMYHSGPFQCVFVF